MLVRKHGISLAMYGKWLTSVVINGLLETRNKDANIPKEMKKKEGMLPFVKEEDRIKTYYIFTLYTYKKILKRYTIQ